MSEVSSVEVREITVALLQPCRVQKCFSNLLYVNFPRIMEAATGGVLDVLGVPESPFKKVAGLRHATLLRKILAQVFSCEFCEIFKKTFFAENLCKKASFKSHPMAMFELETRNVAHLNNGVKTNYTAFLSQFKGATKIEFDALLLCGHCLNTTFSTVSFGKPVFRLSVLSVFFVLNQMF